MGIEIERKFLIKDLSVIENLNGSDIIQGYLNTDPTKTVRVRLSTYTHPDYFKSAKTHLTIKGISKDHIARPEYEYEIPPKDAMELLEICDNIIGKTRYSIWESGLIWEVDVFKGDNEGLVLVEVELESIDQPMMIPEWVGQEVTGDAKYYNSALAKTPYKDWK